MIRQTLILFSSITIFSSQVLLAQDSMQPTLSVENENTTPDITLTSLDELASTEADNDKIPFESLKTFVDVFDVIKKSYVVEVSNQELIDNAIKGMLTRLDPHSLYMNDKEYHEFNMQTEGEYAGIGVVLDIKAGSMQIVSAIDGSPADKAGLQSGDIISQVDGQNVADLTLSEASQLMAGEVGSQVTITVLRNNQIQEYRFTRQIIATNSVSSQMLDNKHAVVRITQFQEDTAQALQKEIESILVKYELDGVILDLRRNPGGILNSAIESSDLFLDEGLILTIRGRNDQMQEAFEAQAGDILDGVPMVILVDQGSASGAEIMAAALRDNQRAIVIGQPTFGKGSVQTITPLYHGGAVKMTTARYYTPSGESIQAQGVIPQVVLTPLDVQKSEDISVENLRETALPHYLRNPNANFINPQQVEDGQHLASTDFALYEALNILKTMSILSSKAMTVPTAEPSQESAVQSEMQSPEGLDNSYIEMPDADEQGNTSNSTVTSDTNIDENDINEEDTPT